MRLLPRLNHSVPQHRWVSDQGRACPRDLTWSSCFVHSLVPVFVMDDKITEEQLKCNMYAGLGSMKQYKILIKYKKEFSANRQIKVWKIKHRTDKRTASFPVDFNVTFPRSAPFLNPPLAQNLWTTSYVAKMSKIFIILKIFMHPYLELYTATPVIRYIPKEDRYNLILMTLPNVFSDESILVENITVVKLCNCQHHELWVSIKTLILILFFIFKYSNLTICNRELPAHDFLILPTFCSF